MEQGIRRFLKQAEPQILARGRDYFCRGQVLRWTEEEGLVTAEVAGTGPRPYRVRLRLTEEGAVAGALCDCPYDWSPICKHIVAVLLAVQAEERMRTRETARKQRLAALGRLTEQADREALAALVLDYCRKDPAFQRYALARLEDNERRELTYVQRRIRNRAEHWLGLGAGEGPELAPVREAMEEGLDRARIRLERGQPKLGLDLACAVLAEGLAVAGQIRGDPQAILWQADDALELIGLAVCRIREEGLPGEEALARILEQARALEGWARWRYALLNLGLELADREAEPRILETLNGLRDRQGPPEWRTWDLLLRWQLLKIVRGPEEAGAYLEAHQEQDALGQLLALELLEDDDPAGAEAMCLQMLERDPCPEEARWRRVLCEVYRMQGRREARREQLERLRDRDDPGEGRT